MLSVPAKVTNFHNSADTYKPYDAAKAIGDVSPGAPKPPKKNCFAQILIAVIVVAVTVLATAGAASLLGAAAGYGVGGNLPGLNENNTLSNHLDHIATSLIADAATRSVIEGTDFGDNIMAALPNVIAQTIMDAVSHGVKAEPSLSRPGRVAKPRCLGRCAGKGRLCQVETSSH